jgi:hypothetical protein
LGLVVLVAPSMVTMLRWLELDGTDIAPTPTRLTDLIQSGTKRIVPHVDRLTSRQQRKMPVAWRLIVRERT